MRSDRWILALAVALGGAVWVIDAALDAFIFYSETPFLALLVTEVPPHELYIRVVILVLFVVFGIVVSRQHRQLREREREARLFRQLVDEATDSVLVIDSTTGVIEDVNQTVSEKLGYERSELVGESVAKINPEFGDPAEFKEFIESPDGIELENYESTHVSADGTTIPVEVSASNVDANGFTHRVAIARDISDRKERERQITHYRQAVESSRDMLTAVDSEFRYLFANDAYLDFHGIDAETVRGEHVESVLGADAFETIEPSLQDALDGDRVAFEMSRQHATHGERILDIRYFPLRDVNGTINGMGASLRDVTDRREMIEDLRRSRERYESLFDSIRDAILVADTDRQIVDCNRAFTDLFGYRFAEIEGKSTEFIYESETEFEKVGENLERQVEEHTTVQTIKYQKRSGQVFPGETKIFQFRGQDGDVTGFIGLIRDVSDRRVRTSQIRTIDRVLRHNLTNDLTVILGNAEVIVNGETDNPKSCAQRIIRTGEGLYDTTDKEREITNFLAKSRPTVEQDAVDIVEPVVEDISSRHPEADVSLEAPAAEPVIAVDSLGRAIEELIENAIVHSDLDSPAVTVTIEQIDTVVEISVADDGPGIPETERRVLTGQHDIEPLYHGTGLGLWLVHLIVQYSDGRLEFSENEPRGSVITVRLPTGGGITA